MDTNIYEKISITDEERRMLADLLDSERSKRVAKRDEIKAFCWEEGSRWQTVLHAQHAEQFGASEASGGGERHLAAVPDPSPSEDVLGTSDDSEPGPPLAPAPIDMDDLI